MCRVCDVVVVRFGYEDRPGVAKPRPAVVVEVDDGDALLALAKVTSHAPRPEWPGEVALDDWAQEGLLRPSTVRCSKVVEMPVSDVRARVGRLSERDRLAVDAGLRDAGMTFGVGEG